MKGLSKKEIRAVSDLEFRKKYYFNTQDIQHHFENKKQMINTLFTLKKKSRIINLNKNKYYLIPIKARYGTWTDHPLIIADEICDGKDYVIGGWYAAHYWHLTDQIPLQVDIFTTKRQGKKTILNKRFVFHRTTKNNLKNAITKRIGNHTFKIMKKARMEKWMRSRE